MPMLPEELSNGLSSLHPGSPKLTLSLIMEIDDRGNVMSTEVMEGIIQSSYRGIYEEIEDIHTGKKECSDMELMTSISLLYQLYEILKKRRAKEGKIQFESTETYFHFEK